MPGFISGSPLAHDLIRIGDQAIARADDAALRAYFTQDYVFHGPGGDRGFDRAQARTSRPCAPLSCGLRLVREQIIADGRFLAARTTFSGDFTGALTTPPSCPVEPTGQLTSNAGATRHVAGTTTTGGLPRVGCRPTTSSFLTKPRRHRQQVPAELVIALLTSPEGVPAQPSAVARQVETPHGVSLPGRSCTASLRPPR